MPSVFQYLTADLENVQVRQCLPPDGKAIEWGLKKI